MLIAGLIATLVVALYGVEWNAPALATSSGSPYTVPLVTDIDPDPTVVETTIVAAGSVVDVGNGVMASVLTFNGTIPGPEFRLNVGDTVIVDYVNNLGHASGIHWHGIELDNASDGTPLTQNMVQPGDTFLYKFTVTRPGVYWYHPHHHSSTNQVFKGLYGSIIVTDPNEPALQSALTLPSTSETLTMVLSDLTVCKAPPTNDTATYDPALPHVSGGALPAQFGPTPKQLCETAPIDEDGNPRGPYGAGDVPNIQTLIPGPGAGSPVNEGQTVLTNGMNVGGRAGTPEAPGLLSPTAVTLPVNSGQGLRLQFVNAATVRFFRLKLTDDAGTQIPLVRVGGQGGLLDHSRVEGGVVGGFDFKYASGEILIDPGDRADVVVSIPTTATGVLTLWTEDFQRTGPGFSNIPTVPVAHFEVTGSAAVPYGLGAGAPLRAATGDPVEVLGPPTTTLLNPATFSPIKPGLSSQDVRLTNVPSAPQSLGINGVQGAHDPGEPYTTAAHPGSARYATLGSRLELTVTNATNAHHPFHLHGFSIQPISLTRPANPTYLFPYAEFRDNVDVPAQYTLTFRVRLDDRTLMDGLTLGGGLGRWVLHCHIFFHASFGMIGEFNVVAANGNERPYINADDTLVEGTPDDLLTVQGTYDDPDGDPVILTASSGEILDHGDGTWTWTRMGGSTGLVYVMATDSGSRSDQVAFMADVSSPATVTATKTVAGQFYSNGTVTYTVTLNNSGPAAQLDNPDDEFVDTLPASLTLLGALASSGTVVEDLGAGRVHWNGNIPAGGSVTITIDALVNAVSPGTVISNQGLVQYDADGNFINEATAPTDDPGTGATGDPTSFTLSSPASVTGTKTVAGLFIPGSQVRYTVSLANAGPAAQLDNSGDEFVDVLPTGLTLISAVASSGTAVATIATNTVTWNGSLSSGGVTFITIVAQLGAAATTGTIVSNQGAITYDADGNGANEAAAFTDNPGTAAVGDPTRFTVLAPAALTATKVVSGSFTPGGAIAYTVTLTNGGGLAQADNPGAEFTDVLPAGLALVSASATSGVAVATIATRTVTWNGSVAAAASVTINMTATIDGAVVAGTVLANQGTLSFDGDGNGTNDAAGLTDDPGVAGAANPTVFTVSGAPTISAIPDALIAMNGTHSVTFTVGDDLIAPGALTVSGTSSNPVLVPPGGLAFGGTGANRTLTVTPAASQSGQTTITVTVNDGTLSSSEVFVLSVSGPPALTGLTSFTMEENTIATASFTVADDFTSPGALTLSATSSNTALVPDSGIAFGGAGGARTISVTPIAERKGQTTIAVTLSDGTLTSTTAIVVTVAAAGPPLPPTTLAASVSGQTVTFTWIAPAAGPTPVFYVLEGGTATGLSTLPVIATPTNATSFTATLSAGTYYFRARSGNGAGISATSNEVLVPIAASVRVPGAPVGLGVRVAGTRVTANWRPAMVGGGVATWRLDVGTTPGASDVGSFTIPAAQVLVSGDLPAGEYFMRVRGVNDAGPGPASNEVRFRVGPPAACAPPDAPVLFPATVAGPNVTLSWRQPANTAVENYRLLVGSAPGASDIAILDVGAVTAFAADASAGIYHVTVQAGNSCGVSSASASLQVVVSNTPVPPAAPVNVRVRVEGRQVRLDWDAVSGADAYVVEAGAAPGATGVTLPVFAPTLTVAGVPPGTYYVRVRAVGPAGAGVPSAEVVVVVS